MDMPQGSLLFATANRGHSSWRAKVLQVTLIRPTMLRVLEVSGVQTFREPAVDIPKYVPRFVAFVVLPNHRAWYRACTTVPQQKHQRGTRR